MSVAGAAWATLYNGPANCCESAPSIATDANGNTYVAGRSTTSRPTPYGPFNDDIATIKYDADGNEVWARRFDGDGHSTDTPYDIALDAQGNVYVTGSASTPDDLQYVTLKYDTNGNLVWSRYAGGVGYPFYDYALALDVSPQGEVCVTGREIYVFNAGSPVYRFLTVKYDAAGNELWQRTFETPQQRGAQGADVKADGEGNVYVTGKANTLGASGRAGFDIFTIKYDAAGNEAWVRQFDGSGPDEYDSDSAVKLHLDGLGNLYVLGTTSASAQQGDVLVLKYTTGGALLQAARPLHPDNELSVDFRVDSDGNVYVLALKVIPPVDFSPPTLDTITLKLDASGGLAWRSVYASSGGGNDYARGFLLDEPGNVVYAGISAQQGTAFNENYVLVKYATADGTKVGEHSFDGPAQQRDSLHAISRDAAGNIYMTGESDTASDRTVDFLTLKVAPATGESEVIIIPYYDLPPDLPLGIPI